MTAPTTHTHDPRSTRSSIDPADASGSGGVVGAGGDGSSEPAPRSRSIDPTRNDMWRRVRGPLAIVAVLVVAGAIVAALQARSTGGPLDPRSARQAGGRALAVLLQERGVTVQRTDSLANAVAAADDASATVLVTRPDLLSKPQLRRLADTRTQHLVLFAPFEDALTVLAPNVLPGGDALIRTRAPGCDLPAAVRAGAIRVDGPMYRGHGDAVTCYGDGLRGGLVRTRVAVDAASGRPATVRTVDVLGTPGSFANARLGEEGNAALALNLLGDHDRLVWYVPSLADAAPATDAPVNPFALLPAGVRFSVGQVAVAVVLLMLASARRLGPVVAEPLPVVVRASEAVEGRARLYQRARARDRAAEVLRTAARARLARAVGLPPGAAPESVTAAVAARTSRSTADLAGLLTGGQDHSPPDDRTLVRLADDLDTLEQEVRRS